MVPSPFRLGRAQAVGAGTALALLIILVAVLVLRATLFAPIQARLQASDLNRVGVREAVTIRFDQAMDMNGVKVTTSPATALRLSGSGERLVATPATAWRPDQRYMLTVTSISNTRHTATLTGWRAAFTTQPEVAVSAFEVDGRPAAGAATMTSASQLSIVFTEPMRTSSVGIDVNGRAIPAPQVSWSKGGTTAGFTAAAVVPFQTAQVSVSAGAVSSRGDPLSQPARASFQVLGLEPANSTTGVTPGFQTKTPLEIVVENSGPARPQRGLQNADIVYEYISEYSISRMTAIYFNQVPALVGPVRSCRMINPYLDYAYDGLFMCSGASVGTLHYMFGGGGTSLPLVPGVINDFDQGGHFFRSDLNFAPHNLFTDSSRAIRFRSEWKGVHPPTFNVDPPHPDAAVGDPAPAPDVPLHAVSYRYDGPSRTYMRFDHGTPFVDALTGHQLAVKNVILLHVPFHYAGWIEDFNGGAQSVWYDMLGSGPAEVYSDGQLVHATWHMGSASQPYFQNHTPVYFTDPQGRVIRLNTGLTWIHVLGNGQTQ